MSKNAAMWSEVRDGEVYVFWNGELVYKRWIDGQGNKRQPSLLANKGWPPVWITHQRPFVSEAEAAQKAMADYKVNGGVTLEDLKRKLAIQTVRDEAQRLDLE
jgi:hypothetical protein